MKRFAQQFKKQSDKIKLNAQEQFLMREKIITFMEYHPLPVVEGEVRTILSLDNVFKVTRVPWRKMSISLGLVAIAFVVILPTVAEYTVPGDILYPVKVRINEEVRSTLARTPYEKVEWEAQRIERRISEARILAKAGLLTPEAEEAVADAVTQHLSNAGAEITILRESNNTDEATLANMTLSSIFEVQSTAFQVDNENLSISASNTSNVTSVSHTLAGVLEGGRVGLALTNETNTISYDRLMAEIEKQTTRAYERLASIEEVMSDQETADINRRLNDISTRIVEARDQYTQASSEQLQQALKDTQKLIAFMNDIDVRATVEVERIIPMTPTFEERLAVFVPQLERFELEVGKIEQVIQQLADDEVKEDIISSVNELKEYIEKANTVTAETITEVELEMIAKKEQKEILVGLIITAGGDFGLQVDEEIEFKNSTTSATSTI